MVLTLLTTFDGKELKEYFNVVNIDYYDAILGTPFLKKYEVPYH